MNFEVLATFLCNNFSEFHFSLAINKEMLAITTKENHQHHHRSSPISSLKHKMYERTSAEKFRSSIFNFIPVTRSYFSSLATQRANKRRHQEEIFKNKSEREEAEK
jgi:hypothetical protein